MDALSKTIQERHSFLAVDAHCRFCLPRYITKVYDYTASDGKYGARSELRLIISVSRDTEMTDDEARTQQPQPSCWSYRFIYFDVRGAGEICRLTMAAAGVDWTDIRYPMTIAGNGFAVGPDFVRDAATAAFDVNMGKLPILQVVNKSKDPTRAVATLGQSHTIARFIAQQHGLLGDDPIERAHIDTVYECCRDIQSAWYRAKKVDKEKWFAQDLPAHCLRLERALAANQVTTTTTTTANNATTPWCVGTAHVTLADIAVYHTLATPTALVSGATTSLMDGESDRVRAAYYYYATTTTPRCSRIQRCIEAVGSLPEIMEYEEKRPDTFS